MVCLTSCGSQGLPVYTVGARGWHPDRGLSLLALALWVFFDFVSASCLGASCSPLGWTSCSPYRQQSVAVRSLRFLLLPAVRRTEFVWFVCFLSFRFF